MRFVIMHETVTSHDAIGNDIEGMYLVLNERHLCRVYAIIQNNNNIIFISEQELDDCLEKQDTVIIYHHSVYWEHGYQKIKHFRGQIIFRYHNITPEHFFQPYNDRYYQTCKHGRAQTVQLMKEHPKAYWLSDSVYNSQELDLVEEKKKDVCPPFHKIANWSRIKPDEEILRKLTETNELNILFIGRIVPNKGYLDLVEAVRLYILCYGENVHLRIVGKMDSALSEYNDLIKEQISLYHMEYKVEFIGEVEDSTLLAYYMGSDVMLCCSEHEGFFVPGIEAQSLGLPVIAIRECAIPETMGEHQLVFDRDMYKCAAALRFIHKNSEGRSYFIRSGSENYQRRFTQEVIRKQFTGAINRMIGVMI